MANRFHDAVADCLSLPPIPYGYVRVLASDGGIHDVKIDRFKDALKIDPRLEVLPANPMKTLATVIQWENRLDGYFCRPPADWQ